MKTQAWGWLAVAVLAAGLNANYHDGGLQWAHEIVDRIGHNTNAVLALATGNAEQFLTEARAIEVHRQAPSCPLQAAVAELQSEVQSEVQSMVAPAHSDFYRFEAMSARQQARLVRLEANRARIEAQVARLRIPAVAFNPVVIRTPDVSVCPRVRVNIPRMPRVRVPVRVVTAETFGSGPV